MDPSLKKYMNSLKRQANKSKIATIAGIVPRTAEQFDLRPEDEEIFASIPTLDMVEETVELQCRAAVATRALGDELRRVKTVSIPKLKSQLNESAVSLKDALKAAGEARTDA